MIEILPFIEKNILVIIGIILTILIPLVGFLYRRNKKLKALYLVIWKKSWLLKPNEVLRERPFYQYYYQRKEDELIAESLNNGKNILIIGPSLSGKTRAIYQGSN